MLLRLVVVATVVAGLVATGCAGSGTDNGRTKVFVARKGLARGELVLAAINDGAIAADTVPSDIARGDVISDTNAIACMVLERALPLGTILRTSMFVPADRVGAASTLVRGGSIPQACA